MASTGADVFFDAMSVTPLTIPSLKKAQDLNCKPSWFLPSNTSSSSSPSSPSSRVARVLRSISDFQAPLMLPDTSVDTTKDNQPAVSTVVVQKYNGKGYATVTTWE